MTEDEFWEHIEATKQSDSTAHARLLTDRLSILSVDEILDFDHFWSECLHEAYHWDLWGAAYLIKGGCSDDGSEYFCRWLILQGSEVFKMAVANPDSLARVVSPGEDVECGHSPALNAWFAATRIINDRAGSDKLWAALEARHGPPTKYPDLGESWDSDDRKLMRKRYPDLWAMSEGM